MKDLRIALDIMGGDHAPAEIIKGGMEAAFENDSCTIIMVGTKEALQRVSDLPRNVELAQCSSVMGMDESVENLISKRDSSIWVATELVKDGKADAVVSAGSTAAQMSAAVLLLGRIRGCPRPAIGTLFPTMAGYRVLLDIGANPDATPEMLLSFAKMGNVYSRVVLGVSLPRVALLSNGTESGKGSRAVIAAHELIASSGLNFIGNKEGRDLVQGDYDVLVCDGFSGNIALKAVEGAAGAMFSMLKDGLSTSLRRKVGAWLVLPGLKDIKRRLDYAETGGAPLLGVNGVSIICHGSSEAKAIKNAVKVALTCCENDFLEELDRAFADRPR